MTWEEIVAQAHKERKRPSHREDAMQMECIKWFDYAHYDLHLLLFHPANEGKVTKTQAVRRKQMGIRAGVADLILLVPNKKYSSLAIELKTHEGRQSQNQKVWQTIHELHNGLYVIVRSVEEFIDSVEQYLNNR